MRLFPRRAPGATLTVTPDRPVLPTESVTATVTLAEQVDGVTDARVELGYLNTYTYEWARGSSEGPGGHKATTDWVHVISEPLVFAGGSLAAGPHSATLRLPSWSPGSSASTVAWVARLVVERAGTSPRAEGTFTVLAQAPDPLPVETRLVQGERANARSITFDLMTDALVYRPGEEVRGTLTVTPTEPVTRTATADIRFYRAQVSHPLERAPAPRLDHFTRPAVTVAEGLTLGQGVTTEVPFAATLPADADPTTEAVHSSLEWWVVATVTFAGMTGAIEKARREIIVVTA